MAQISSYVLEISMLRKTSKILIMFSMLHFTMINYVTLFVSMKT